MNADRPIALVDLDHGLCPDLAENLRRGHRQVPVTPALLKVLSDLSSYWQFYLTTHLPERDLKASFAWRDMLARSGLSRYPVTYLPYDEPVSDHKFRLAQFLGALVSVEGNKATANVLAVRGQRSGLSVVILPRGPISEGIIVPGVTRLTSDEELGPFLRRREVRGVSS